VEIGTGRVRGRRRGRGWGKNNSNKHGSEEEEEAERCHRVRESYREDRAATVGSFRDCDTLEQDAARLAGSLRLPGDINTSGNVTGAAEWKNGKVRRGKKREQ
jgi:hypothetical protein